MKITDFEIYRCLLREKSGLTLNPDKSYLLESRLNPVAKKWNFSSLEEMTASLNGLPDKDMVKDIVEAMTTNETSFFRDNKPFEMFIKDVLPFLIDARRVEKKIRIWCAAASSGQEPYSLAILLKENAAQLAGWNIEIVATDISDEILDQARKAVYTQFEVQRGLPIQMLMKYFTQQDDKWALNDDIKRMVQFKNFNLFDNMAGFGQLDVIMCRNVLIYFDDEGKRNVLDRMKACLKPDGCLFLGSTETLFGITDSFKPIPDKRGIYCRADSPHLEKVDAA